MSSPPPNMTPGSKNLVLVGYRGTGKSSVAELLGAALGRDVVSLDAEIVKSARCPIPDIVRDHGWGYFRDLEEEMCRRHAARQRVILDCGGGVVEREANFETLRAGAMVFWLKASPASIVARIASDSGRPSLTGTNSFTDEVEEVLVRRTPLYRRMAHVEIETDGRAMREIAAEIVGRFRDAR